MHDRVAFLNQLAALILTLLFCWMMVVPAHKRQLMVMKLARTAQSQSQRLAQASAGVAMKRELAGDEESAALGYDAAYRIMTDVHKRASRWYEKLRGAS